MGFPGGAGGKEPTSQSWIYKRLEFDSRVWKILRRRAWQPTLVFLPGESHGQRNLVGYSPWGCRVRHYSVTNTFTSLSYIDFPDSSVGKEPTCNTGDPGSIPVLERSAGEGIGYPLQYSWASLVAQLVKSPPAMQKTWIWPLGCKDHLEKGK